MRRSRLCLFAAIMMAASMAAGQSNPNTDQGMKPYDSFHGGGLDSVSLTSGNLYFHKPLYSVVQRGRVGLTFSLQYNNKGFNVVANCSPPPNNRCAYRWVFGGSGVTVVNDEQMAVGGKNVDTGQTNGVSELFTTVYSAVTADGATHQLGYTGSVYRAIDGSGILWDGSSPSARDRSGVYVGSPGASPLDPNGNTIVANTQASAWTDTLGRVIPSPPRSRPPTAAPA